MRMCLGLCVFMLCVTLGATSAFSCEFIINDTWPWMIRNHPALKGIQWEAAEAVIARAGVNCQLRAESAVNVNQRLKTRLSRFSFRNITPSNIKEIDFIEKLLTTPVLVVARKGRSLKFYEDLKDFDHIVVARGVTYGDPFDDDNSIKRYEEDVLENGMRDFITGKADAIVGSALSLLTIAKSENALDMMGDRMFLSNTTQYLVTNKGEAQAPDVQAMAAALAALREEGAIKAIIDRHIGAH